MLLKSRFCKRAWLLVKNNQGVLLLETLISASVMLAGFSFSLYFLNQWIAAETLDSAVASVEKALYQAQTRALSDGKSVILRMDNTHHSLIISEGIKTIDTIAVSKKIIFTPASHDLRIKYNQLGSVSQAGVIIIGTGEKTVRLVLLLGQGRFYFKK